MTKMLDIVVAANERQPATLNIDNIGLRISAEAGELNNELYRGAFGATVNLDKARAELADLLYNVECMMVVLDVSHDELADMIAKKFAARHRQ